MKMLPHKTDNSIFLLSLRQFKGPERSHVMGTPIITMMRKASRVNNTWLVDGHRAKQLFYIVYTCFIAGGKRDKSMVLSFYKCSHNFDNWAFI